jgi:ribosomal protein S18 acetylase RimI-like enzyme
MTQTEREIRTRPANSSDQDFLLEVYAGVRREEMLSWGWSTEQQRDFVRMQFLSRRQSYLLQYPDASESVIVVDGAPAGSMTVFRGASEIRLVDIAVLPEFRGRGIGGGLITGLAHEAVCSGLPLRLSVAQGNRAARLYGRIGFVSTGRDSMYIEMEYAAKARESH